MAYAVWPTPYWPTRYATKKLCERVWLLDFLVYAIHLQLSLQSSPRIARRHTRGHESKQSELKWKKAQLLNVKAYIFSTAHTYSTTLIDFLWIFHSQLTPNWQCWVLHIRIGVNLSNKFSVWMHGNYNYYALLLLFAIAPNAPNKCEIIVHRPSARLHFQMTMTCGHRRFACQRDQIWFTREIQIRRCSYGGIWEDCFSTGPYKYDLRWIVGIWDRCASTHEMQIVHKETYMSCKLFQLRCHKKIYDKFNVAQRATTSFIECCTKTSTNVCHYSCAVLFEREKQLPFTEGCSDNIYKCACIQFWDDFIAIAFCDIFQSRDRNYLSSEKIMHGGTKLILLTTCWWHYFRSSVRMTFIYNSHADVCATF